MVIVCNKKNKCPVSFSLDMKALDDALCPLTSTTNECARRILSCKQRRPVIYPRTRQAGEIDI